jgi:hypothetical protein
MKENGQLRLPFFYIIVFIINIFIDCSVIFDII